jgi:pimeloyl-ACP methyl ester carboxylesterase
MNTSSTRLSTPEAPGSVSQASHLPAESTDSAGLSRKELLRRGLGAGIALGGAGLISGAGPLADGAQAATKSVKALHLPAGFTDTFTSRYIKTGALRQHTVIGGNGPPLLLVHGWPENWYAWRLLMPALARDFQVIAVDQRGMGLSDKPRHGYDPATIASDLIGLMDTLGHRRFAVVGCDTGMVISYALAADHRDRVDRLVVGESVVPGVTPSPPLFVPGPLVAHVWHLLFNRLAHTNEQLVRGREDIFFGLVYAAEAGKKLPDYAVRYYINGFASSRDALRGSFEFYRAWDGATKQNQQRAKRRLTLPVLAIGGALGLGKSPADAMKLVADDVQSLIIPDCGHWLAEEAPKEMLAALTAFLAPYRNSPTSVHSRPNAAAFSSPR